MDTTTRRMTNGYRVSVIDYGYGDETRPYESAIIHDGVLCYRTTVDGRLYDDVRGWMTADDVAQLRAAVRRLPRMDGCSHERMTSWLDDDTEDDDTEDTTS